MKRFAFVIIVVLCFVDSRAAGANLDSLYRVLDTAIDSFTIYKQHKMDAVNTLKRQYYDAKDKQEKYQFAYSLYREYMAFANDSALNYLQVCLDMADEMGRKDLRNLCELYYAHQLTASGYFHEADIHFNSVNRDMLSSDMLIYYLSRLRKQYGEMGYYTPDLKLRDQFFAKANAILDTLFQIIPKDSPDYYNLKVQNLNSLNQFDESLSYSDKWLSLVQPGTREYAIMAFYRSEIYKNKGDFEMQQYWLIQAALVDVRLAIMDQSALWSLADYLSHDKESIDRANKYMDFSWECISSFSTHMRSWLVSPILTRINDKYREKLRQTNTGLWTTLAAVGLLLVVLTMLLFDVSKKRKQLAKARNELKSANEELVRLNNMLYAKNEDLAETNRLMSDTNEQLRMANARLNDTNRMKEECIGEFFSICSDYIDQQDRYRVKVNRKLKAGQHAELYQITKSEESTEEELKKLFDNFDDMFLRLFPTFVDEFNALLRPGEEILPTENNKLTTDLRIFALIRLGIEESSKIASFLHYSPNSIYAYRARIKNKAAGDREEFEKQVKEIGLKE